MRLLVDRDRCVAAGQCVIAAPEVFDQREEDGTVVLLSADPSAELRDNVRQAALLCPSQAIIIAEGS